MLTTIKLSGSLCARFGREYKLDVSTTTEAAKALCVVVDGFEQFMKKSRRMGLGFAVFVNRRNIGESELEYETRGKEIRIVPVVIGSKKGGFFQVILGAVMIAAGALLWATPFVLPLVSAGAGMLLTGAIQMFSPTVSGLGMRESPENKPSYAFGGPVNTVGQGDPIGILYGEREIGGAIISAAILTEDQR